MAALKRSDRSLSRKLAEIYVALLIERHLTKRQILHRYLNAAYFGHGIFGIEQAALTFCGRRTIELDVSDAAYLVALLKAPARYCRCCNPGRAEQRTSIVARLAGIHDRLRVNTSRRWQLRNSFSSYVPMTYPYAIEFVRKCLFQLVPQYYPQHRLKILTTIDPSCQSVLESVCAYVRRLGYTGRLACIIQDARSGNIKAMAGGTTFREQRFNAAADGLLQPGSLIKPFILLAAIRAGVSLDYKYVSRPLTVNMRNGQVWAVRNAGERYTGLTTIADATVHSDNTVYAQLLQEIGLQKTKRVLTRVGMPAQDATLAISTGRIDLVFRL
jgi:membrane peptidoglycan carboxypeptidase